MSVKQVIVVLILGIGLAAFITIGFQDAVKRNDLKEFQRVQLKSKSFEIKQLNNKYEKLDEDLEKAKQDNSASQEQIDEYKKQQEKLLEEMKIKEAQLQAKAEAKNRLAAASTKVVNAATNTSTASASSGGSLEAIIAAAAAKYGVSNSMMIRLATCESTMGKNLKNPSPVVVNGVNYGHAEGVFQFIPSTWTRMSTQAGFAGASVYDTYANVNTAAWAFANGSKSEWECK